MFMVIWILFGIATAIAASNKGKSGFLWFLIGCLLGPFGLLFALLIKAEQPKAPTKPFAFYEEKKKCPYCAEEIKAEASICRFCNKTLPELKGGTGEFLTEIVGESYYQEALNSICGGKTREGHKKVVTAKVTPENDNKHDSNAYKVVIEGATVGYMSKKAARELRAAVGDKNINCQALITGGWHRGENEQGNYGVKLDMSW